MAIPDTALSAAKQNGQRYITALRKMRALDGLTGTPAAQDEAVAKTRAVAFEFLEKLAEWIQTQPD